MSYSKQDQLEQVAQGLVQLILGYIQGQRFYNLSKPLLQCLTTLRVKIFFRVSNQNFTYSSLCLLLSWYRESVSIFFVSFFQVVAHNNKTSPPPAFLKAEQTQFSQPLLICPLLQPWTILVILTQTHSSISMPFLYWGAQNWTQYFRLWSHVLKRGEGNLLKQSKESK